MRKPFKTKRLLADTITAWGATGAIILEDEEFKQLAVHITVDNVSGTTPTVIFTVQQSLDGGNTWLDWVTTLPMDGFIIADDWLWGGKMSWGAPSPEDDGLQVAGGGGLAANGPIISSVIRVRYDITGSSPSFDVVADAYFS